MLWAHAAQRIQDRAPDCIREMPACFLLDQAKAFEYLDHRWLRSVLKGWKRDDWSGALLLTMAEGRRLMGHPLPLKPGTPLRRGVGMGGTASMFTWSLCFDPIAWIAAKAAGIEHNIYVDDLSPSSLL